MTFKSAILSFVNLQTENMTVVFRCHLKKRSYIYMKAYRQGILFNCMHL